MTTEAIIPGGVNTAIPFECRAVAEARQASDRMSRLKPRNETLAWLAEQERSRNVRCCPDPEIRP